jgi:hypothetical protein
MAARLHETSRLEGFRSKVSVPLPFDGWNGHAAARALTTVAVQAIEAAPAQGSGPDA